MKWVVVLHFVLLNGHTHTVRPQMDSFNSLAECRSMLPQVAGYIQLRPGEKSWHPTCERTKV
jgi:hypothetical protein